MASDRGVIRSGALEDVAYLSRSANRIRILDALATESATRRELGERTGVSRTTLDRIVNELEDRGWVRRTSDGDYAVTSTGEHLMGQFEPFIESVAAVRRLGEAVTWLPTEELSVELRHFSDATVRRPEHGDPMETIDFFVDLGREATDIRVLTGLAPPDPLAREMHAGHVDERLSGSYVLTAELARYLRNDPQRRDRFREMVEAGADVYSYDGPLPCNLFVFDETVLIKAPNAIEESYGTPIVSEDEAVRSWARTLIARCRSDAARLDADAFADDSVARSAPDGDVSGRKR